MVLPSASAIFWSRNIDYTIAIAISLAFLSGWVGLLISYHGDLPSGPSIVITAGTLYIFSICFVKFKFSTVLNCSVNC
jgi:zinc/manganese transport system permease protein